MTALGHIALRHSRSFNEARQKFLRLILALGYNEIATSRAITAFSECCRAAVQNGIGLGICFDLDLTAHEHSLTIEYSYARGIALPTAAYKLYKCVKSPAHTDLTAVYKCSMPLPENAGFSDCDLDNLRQIVAMPSREDLLHDLESRNEALSRSESRITTILESTPDALLIINRTGCITYANSQAERTFGFTREELVNKNIALLIPQASNDEPKPNLAQYFRSGGATQIVGTTDLQAQTKSGQQMFVDITLSPLQTESGKQIIASVRDVTEQKKNQMLVKKLSRVVEQSPVSVIITDTDSNIEYVNPAFCSITGYAKTDVIGMPSAVFASHCNGQDAYAAARPNILMGKVWNGQCISQKKNGEHFWESVSIAPILNQKGQITHFVAVRLDITERIQSEEEIKKQRALLDSLINTLPLLICHKNPQGEYQVVNDAFCSFLGRPREEILNRTIFDLRPPEYARGVFEKDQRVMTSRKSLRDQFWRTYPDGSEVMFDMQGVPFEDENDNLLGVINVYRDITEQVRMEMAVRESEVKYRELVENANSIILKLDCSGLITFFNEFAQQFFGFTEEEVLGKPLVGTIAPEQETSGRNLDDLFARMVRDPHHFVKNENENICKDGRRVWVNWTNRALYDETTGALAGLLCVGLDATERKKSQQERDEALEVISGSIRYASRIQRAILPSADIFETAAADHFVVWVPRDVVGGDIYLGAQWGDGYLFVLGDCTGHGVPGAFMTMIASSALSRALSEVTPGRVARLLKRVHQIMQENLNQHTEGGDSDDGMELGMIFVQPQADRFCYAGARFPLFILNRDEMHEIKGDKKGIAYRHINFDQDFTEYTLDIEPGMRLYMVSDGVIDQIGGEKRRSFGKNRFRSLLLEMADLPLHQQGAILNQALIQYQGAEHRRDDVSIMGLEF